MIVMRRRKRRDASPGVRAEGSPLLPRGGRPKRVFAGTALGLPDVVGSPAVELCMGSLLPGVSRCGHYVRLVLMPPLPANRQAREAQISFSGRLVHDVRCVHDA